MNQSLSDRVLNMSESATIGMAQKARLLKSEGKDVISLSLGEPDFDTPDFIKDAAKKALDNGYTKYTPVPGLKELREAICNKLKRDNNLDYKESQIVVSNGAKQSIANVCLSLLNNDDEVIIFSPFWVSYFEIVKLAKGKPVLVNAGINQDFKVDAKQFESAITEKTKLVIFSSPCNPTGSVFTHAELSEIAKVLEKNPQIMIISDEIYEYINFDGDHTSLAQFPKIKNQVVVINGMSKGFAMTGWRLGYIAAPEFLAKACSKIQGQFTSGATSFGQKAASIALNEGREESEKMKTIFQSRKRIFKELLDTIPGLKTNDPKGAFYFFPDWTYYRGKSHKGNTITNSAEFCEYLLQEALVATVPGIAFGDDDYFRMSYATSEEQLKQAASRIKTAVEKLN